MAYTPNGSSEAADQKPKIGFGLFLLLAGLVLLAQRVGWIPSQLDWFIPAVLIAWGASEIFRQMR